MGSSVILPPPGQPVTGPDKTFKTADNPNVVSFGFEKITPPSFLYVQRDDVLLLQIISAAPSEQVTFAARLLLPVTPITGQPVKSGQVAGPQTFLPGGTIIPIVQTLAIGATYNLVTKTLPLAEGYLLAVAATSSQASNRGQTFARALLVRAEGGTRQPVATLFADYCTINGPVGWPGGRTGFPSESSGRIRNQQVGTPAAGADWTFTNPTNSRLRVISLNAQFVTLAAAANRNVQIIVDDGLSTQWTDDAAASIVANTTQQISVTGLSVPTGVITTISHIAIPPALVLSSGWRIRSVTANIQGGDQWSAIWLNGEEWLDT